MPQATRVDLVVALFRAHPGEWLDGRELAHVGGAYAWRTRVSDARRLLGRIDNRVRRLSEAGRTWQVSEYCYVPRGHPEAQRLPLEAA